MRPSRGPETANEIAMSLRTFTTEALRDIQTTASLVPSSSYLTRAMLAPLPLARAQTVVELGPGTGVMTRALLAALPPDAKLLCFEVNPRFREYLQATIADPRLVVVASSAERVAEELAARGVARVDAAASSLGITLMPDRKRHAIARGLAGAFGPESVLTQFQYLHSYLMYFQRNNGGLKRFSIEDHLGSYFSRIERETVWLNVPPAFVFACRL
jgi:phospholipid N-methyltransferase